MVWCRPGVRRGGLAQARCEVQGRFRRLWGGLVQARCCSTRVLTRVPPAFHEDSTSFCEGCVRVRVLLGISPIFQVCSPKAIDTFCT